MIAKDLTRKAGVLAAVGVFGIALAGCGGSGSGSSGSSASSSAAKSSSGSSATSKASSSAAAVTIQETGSSLMYPLFNVWVPAYIKNHNVKIDTGSTGSGTGIADATKGTVQIGASDAYLNAGLRKQNPDLMNIPLVISSQMVVYNLPSVKQHLHLSGPELAAIYSGTITKWNDPKIKASNPGVTLPNLTIVPIHRSDGSGDTFIFTQYLSKSTPSWSNGPGFGVSVSWPAVQGAQGAKGNNGMVNAVSKTKGGIAYIGISWQKQVQQANLNWAALGNQAGNYVLPTAQNVTSAAAALEPKTPANEALSLIFAPGANSYPIINYEYAIVHAKQQDAATGAAVKALLTWAVDPNGGSASSFLSPLGFHQLPASIRKLSLDQINKIH